MSRHDTRTGQIGIADADAIVPDTPPGVTVYRTIDTKGRSSEIVHVEPGVAIRFHQHTKESDHFVVVDGASTVAGFVYEDGVWRRLPIHAHHLFDAAQLHCVAASFDGQGTAIFHIISNKSRDGLGFDVVPAPDQAEWSAEAEAAALEWNQ